MFDFEIFSFIELFIGEFFANTGLQTIFLYVVGCFGFLSILLFITIPFRWVSSKTHIKTGKDL